ncbi:aldehyde dehydrogenase family protein [Planosporangium thailandense]|uniref:Aldehyde dehydrogenase family protein n=1 Tax=Planosporangium thailandense TaxID=765197 RepID=A0ABX0Y1R5_9ACTN|nr:aldehyde dehydrogenase family protein [Planosporangium thailandense]NJC71412.1 aldehyde dehydrogenase family protein [Planosporangium thailandense]
MQVHPRILLAGEWVDGAGPESLDLNPARPSEVVARVRTAGDQEIDAAVAAARRAWPAWAAMPIQERAAILARAAAYLDASAETFGEELTREEGKTRAEGIGEVRRAAEILRFFASEGYTPNGEVYPSPRAGEQIQVVRRPVGVVGVITPWNFPIAIPAWKIAPALVYGNAVVWKPASLVPVLAYRLAEALVNAGLPAGVLSLLYAKGSAAQALVEHAGVDAVTFTGSTPVGRQLAARCGELLKPLQAELGGKNAAVVLAGADLELAADQVVLGAMRSTGQKCTATSRLIVEEAVADPFLELLRARVDRLQVGDPLEPGVDMGPAASADARQSILDQIAAAVRQGAVPVTGGEPYRDGLLGEGYFVPPTVLALPDVTPALWREEVFGPVLAVVRAESAQHALHLANDTEFGLSGAIFTNDLDAVMAAIDHFEVGVLHVNSETAGADPHVPFGGIKQSGLGPKEQGRAAREFFTHSKTVYLRPAR